MIQKSTTDLAMSGRRLLFASLVAGTMIGMLWLMASALSVDGLSLGDIALLVLFFFTLPWMATGFWNSTIGFLIWRLARDPLDAVIPMATGIDPFAPITSSTAILLCVRNESPERSERNLTLLLQGLTNSLNHIW